jgi:hypothetical protein
MPLSFMGLITGKKIKTHTSQGIVKNKCTKPTKEWFFKNCCILGISS